MTRFGLLFLRQIPQRIVTDNCHIFFAQKNRTPHIFIAADGALNIDIRLTPGSPIFAVIVVSMGWNKAPGTGASKPLNFEIGSRFAWQKLTTETY